MHIFSEHVLPLKGTTVSHSASIEITGYGRGTTAAVEVKRYWHYSCVIPPHLMQVPKLNLWDWMGLSVGLDYYESPMFEVDHPQFICWGETAPAPKNVSKACWKLINTVGIIKLVTVFLTCYVHGGVKTLNITLKEVRDMLRTRNN